MTEVRPTAARLGPLPISEWSDEAITQMRGNLSRAEKYLTRDPSAPPLPALLGLFGHHPRLSSSFMAFSGQVLDDPVLDPRDREILVLRTAYRTRSEYEWAQHIRIGYETGLTPAHIPAVIEGADHEIWSDSDRLLIRATDELIDDQRLSEATYAGLADIYTSQELMELLFTVGGYLCLALVLNSVQLPADSAPEFPLPDLALTEGD